MALSNEPLIKALKAKEIGDGLYAAAVPDVDWSTALLLLGYDPAKFDEEALKQAKIKDLIADAPRNKENRGFSLGDAKRWFIQMGKGLWVQNGQCAAYDAHGQIVTAQHRLGAFLMLVQQWMKKRLPEYMEKVAKSKTTPTIPMSFIFNVSTKKHVADTADTGRSRTLADVLFRADLVSGKGRTEKEKTALVKALSVAARLVWLRAGGRAVRNGPKFDQAEGLAFAQDKHPTLVKSVEFIDSLNDNTSGGITTFLTIGVAAGLMYLMSTSTTVFGEDLSFENDEKAEEFWSLFVKPDGHPAGSPIAALREFYTRANKQGTRDRDETNNAAIKAWIAFLDGRKDVKWSDLKTGKDESAHTGGLDISAEDRARILGGEDPEPATEPAKKAPKGKAAKGKPAKGKGKPAKKAPKAKPESAPADDDDIELIPDQDNDDEDDGQIDE